MEGKGAEDNTGPIRSKADKSGRRGWGTKEEEVLAGAMKRIVREGWKSENGFKAGFLALLEKYMKEVLPTTDLKAEPHITSRITVWKKNYNTLFEILKHTGVGIDSTTNMVEATDEQWAGFIRRDPNARLMRSKSWPLYLAWCEIFGTSRATGEQSEDFVNAAKTPPPEPTPVNEGDEEKQDESQTPTGVAQTGESSGLAKASSGRKRKTSMTSDPMISVMQDFADTACARLGEISQRIGYEQDLSAARKSIYASLSAMHDLTQDEKLRANTLIGRNADDIDVFFSFPDADRVAWVKMLLAGKL